MGNVILFVGSIALFIAFIAGAGALWNHFQWVRLGRPNFSSAETLQIDLLRASGLTQTAARRKVFALRSSPFAAEVENIRTLEDLMTNPAREHALRSVALDMQSAILMRDDGDPLKQMFIESRLDSAHGPKARKNID